MLKYVFNWCWQSPRNWEMCCLEESVLIVLSDAVEGQAIVWCLINIESVNPNTVWKP